MTSSIPSPDPVTRRNFYHLYADIAGFWRARQHFGLHRHLHGPARSASSWQIGLLTAWAGALVNLVFALPGRSVAGCAAGEASTVFWTSIRPTTALSLAGPPVSVAAGDMARDDTHFGPGRPDLDTGDGSGHRAQRPLRRGRARSRGEGGRGAAECPSGPDRVGEYPGVWAAVARGVLPFSRRLRPCFCHRRRRSVVQFVSSGAHSPGALAAAPPLARCALGRGWSFRASAHA